VNSVLKKPQIISAAAWNPRSGSDSLKWIEQQGKTSEELNAQWDPDFWREMFEGEIAGFERLIAAFNREVGA